MSTSYQVFARKYRPLSFKDILGQDHVVQTLANAIEQNRLAHAYLLLDQEEPEKHQQLEYSQKH